MPNNWYVITGGPATGKTTIIKKLKQRGYKTVSESARAVIHEAISSGMSAEELHADEFSFQNEIFKRKLSKHLKLDSEALTFLDRGMHDTGGYLSANGLSLDQDMKDVFKRQKYKKVFILEPLSKYRSDKIRSEDKEHARSIHEGIRKCYQDYELEPISVPKMGIKDRVEFILSQVADDNKNEGMTYKESGVNYASIDPAKVSAQSAAAGTAKNLEKFGMQEVAASRGESAYVWEEEDAYRALVVEGLGTKNLVANAMYEATGKSYYDQIAQDTIAMIVNDLIVVGALPNVVNAYFALSSGEWMDDKQRAADLITGWAKACNMAGATWGGGETPALKGIIQEGKIDLAGSAVGIIKPKKRLVLGEKLEAGDVIVLIESSGVHANGLTMVRSIANKLTDGYQTKLSDDRSFGEAILSPTHIYVDFVRSMLEAELDLHYMANITGHGWRKIMRAEKDLSYHMSLVPEVPSEFELIQKEAKADNAEMYGNFNMGAGYAVYLPKNQAEKVVELASANNLKAWVAGEVKQGPKQVVIEPLDISFSENSLGVR